MKLDSSGIRQHYIIMDDYSFLHEGEGEVTGKGTINLSLGPVSDSDIIGMATLSREYHPGMLFGGSNPDGVKCSRTLSKIWITGLLDIALRSLVWPERILGVTISHKGACLAGRRISLELEASSLDTMTNRATLTFKVRQKDSGVIASGAVVVSSSP